MDISIFFKTFFKFRDQLHYLHFSTHSFSKHLALEELYTEILDTTDELIEVMMGQYGLFKAESMEVVYTYDYKTLFENILVEIKSVRTSIPSDDTHLQNIIDELVALIYRTLYKLNTLK